MLDCHMQAEKDPAENRQNISAQICINLITY